jgi:hypothetical protein
MPLSPTQYAGIALIVLGCLFVLAGLFKFIAETVLQLRAAADKKGVGPNDLGNPADVITAISKLPPFAISVVLGIALIILGAWLYQGHSPFS